MTDARNGWREARARGRRVSRRPAQGEPSRRRPRARRIAHWFHAASLAFAVGISMSANVTGQASERFDSSAARPLQLRKAVEIRASESDAAELTAPQTVLADSNRIYVLDPGAFGVHQFDRRGQWISTIGGRGEGPGEFRRPVAMGRLSDTLWVADRGLSRLSFISLEGVHLRSVRFSTISGSTIMMPQRAFSGGRIASVPYISARSTAPIDSLPILLFNEDGNVQDTIAWRALGQTTVSISTREGGVDGDIRTMSINHPFDRRSLLAYDPRSRWLYLATWRAGSNGADALELLQIASTGDTVAVAHLPLGRETLSRRKVRSYATRIHGDLPESFRSRVSAGELASAFMQQVAKPSETAVDAMIAGENGTIWLREADRTSVAASEHWSAYRFGEGFTESIQLPVGQHLLAGSERMLWTVSRDELGLPTVTGWVTASPGPDSSDGNF